MDLCSRERLNTSKQDAIMNETLEYTDSTVCLKTLKSKYYVEQNYVNEREVTGTFRQFHYNYDTKATEMIQAYKQYGNFVKSYSLFKNRRCIERGDCLNLEYLPTDEHKDETLHPVRIKSNSTFDFNETKFVVRFNYENEGDVFCFNRNKNFALASS